MVNLFKEKKVNEKNFVERLRHEMRAKTYIKCGLGDHFPQQKIFPVQIDQGRGKKSRHKKSNKGKNSQCSCNRRVQNVTSIC